MRAVASFTRLGFLTLMLAVSACGSSQSERETAAPPGGSRVADSNVFKEPVRAMERAEQVQQLIMDKTHERDADMDRLIDDTR